MRNCVHVDGCAGVGGGGGGVHIVSPVLQKC
jgi:hypothetical protein